MQYMIQIEICRQIYEITSHHMIERTQMNGLPMEITVCHIYNEKEQIPRQLASDTQLHTMRLNYQQSRGRPFKAQFYGLFPLK